MALYLGISCYYHDSAAVLLKDEEVLYAIQEERLTRKKHDPAFPEKSIKYILEQAGLNLADIDAIIYYEKPLLKFERILSEIHTYVPRGRKHFVKSIPLWIKEKLFFKSMLWSELEAINGGKFKKRPKLLFTEHHLSHMASTFYPSPFEEAAIMTLDGVGEWTTLTLGKGSGSQIESLETMSYPHSIGMLYSAFTYFLGFKVNSGEYKLMGLAPYGSPGSERVETFKKQIKENLIDIGETGHLKLNLDWFKFHYDLVMCDKNKWVDLFGVGIRVDGDDFSQDHMDLALAIQQVTEEIVILLAKYLKRITGCKNLVMAGGVALNCVANAKLRDEKVFDEIWIQPAAGDAGGALGAAYCGHYIFNNKHRTVKRYFNPYLGPSFTNFQIESLLKAHDIKYKLLKDEDLLSQTADILAGGKVVGWFQDKMEWGPRALGNRSILADPRSEAMQKVLNLKIKKREGFRPFAPIMTERAANKLFNQPEFSPYMLFISHLKDEFRNKKPEGYDDQPIMDKLYFKRSHLPAITHIDYSARLQTVSSGGNPKMFDLLKKFGEVSGEEVLVNTSFNVRGEPIICNPFDAVSCFFNTEMDYLVLENILISKEDHSEEFAKKFEKEFQAD